MKKLTIAGLSVIFVTLIACSVQSISADHESGNGIFKDRSEVNLTIHSPDNTIQSSDYKIYLQAIIRNGDDQLINVTESTEAGSHVPHKITDYVFDTLMGEKEIVTIDNIRYEKVQYTFSPTLEQRWIGMYPIFEQVPIEIKVEGLAKGEIFSVIKDHSIWKIHYCADFSSIGHDGIQCIPIFQVLVPNITLESSDVIIHHWTILRELN